MPPRCSSSCACWYVCEARQNVPALVGLPCDHYKEHGDDYEALKRIFPWMRDEGDKAQ